MLQSTEKVLRYTEGMDEAAFKANQQTRDAVIYNIQILGELPHISASARFKRTPRSSGARSSARGTASYTTMTRSATTSSGV
ncbi:MAG: DUF86 domain-containing protein [Flavobacteriales bacterium]|nr:DUF86 domain-containing protein [Flavobacteriales bacterium]